MTITIDSNILLSIFAGDSLCDKAMSLMKKYRDYDYIINDIIYLETGFHFQDLSILDQNLEILEVTYVESAGMNHVRILNAWRQYLRKKTFTCPNCGEIPEPVCPICNHSLSFRQKILPDFLIADFVLENSKGILTFDFHYYKNYFQEIKILD